MQNKLDTIHPLLSENGQVIEAGWANNLIVEYNKLNIKQIDKVMEWEYYLCLAKQYAFAVSVAALGKGGSRRMSVHFMNFDTKEYFCDTDWTSDEVNLLNMPTTVNQSINFEGQRSKGSYVRIGDTVEINIDAPGFDENKNLKANMKFSIPEGDNMAIIVPYSDPELFYYNFKTNCMTVSGEVIIDEVKYSFNDTDSIGTYDWGRGIWEPVNQWYWGSLSTTIKGKPFGFNIGHGFGDTSKATENMIFYDRKCNKIDQITFRIKDDIIGDLSLVLPEENYMMPWQFTSNDGRLDMSFKPILDRTSLLVPGEYFEGQHQVFGLFSGIAILDDGVKIEFQDEFGFAEKVGNVWLGL